MLPTTCSTSISSRRPGRWAAIGLVLLTGACAGTRGVLLDLWSWDEITQRADKATINVEEGAIEVAAFDRNNIWLQRHVYAFEGSLETADYWVENREFIVEFACDGPATCFADHWLEVPTALPLNFKLDKGSISIIAAAGPIAIEAGEVEVYAEEVRAPDVQVNAANAPIVSLAFAAAPTRVAVFGRADNLEIWLPAGQYACGQLPAHAVVDPGIVCNPASTSRLELTASSQALALRVAVP